jgi:hypothetical protein
MPSRINRAIELLGQDQAIYYTGHHTGHVLSHAQGREDAQTWADYINIGMEHGAFDVAGDVGPAPVGARRHQPARLFHGNRANPQAPGGGIVTSRKWRMVGPLRNRPGDPEQTAIAGIVPGRGSTPGK